MHSICICVEQSDINTYMELILVDSCLHLCLIFLAAQHPLILSIKHKFSFEEWLLFSSIVLVVVEWLSHVQLWDPVDYSLPDSSFHGVLQARILEWIATSFSRGSYQPGDQTQVSCIADRFFTHRENSESRACLSLGMSNKSALLTLSFKSQKPSESDTVFQDLHVMLETLGWRKLEIILSSYGSLTWLCLIWKHSQPFRAALSIDYYQSLFSAFQLICWAPGQFPGDSLLKLPKVSFCWLQSKNSDHYSYWWNKLYIGTQLNILFNLGQWVYMDRCILLINE